MTAKREKLATEADRLKKIGSRARRKPALDQLRAETNLQLLGEVAGKLSEDSLKRAVLVVAGMSGGK